MRRSFHIAYIIAAAGQSSRIHPFFFFFFKFSCAILLKKKMAVSWYTRCLASVKVLLVYKKRETNDWLRKETSIVVGCAGIRHAAELFEQQGGQGKRRVIILRPDWIHAVPADHPTRFWGLTRPKKQKETFFFFLEKDERDVGAR